MPENIGTVAELARAWKLTRRLARAASYGPALAVCFDCTVEVSGRAKTVAGTAFTRDRRIVLNGALLREGREDDRDSTLLHECAHVIANLHRRRDCGHGEAWRHVMDAIGEPPERCHNIAYLSAKRHATVTWVCQGCGVEYHFVRRPRRKLENCWCSRCGPGEGRLAVKRVARGRGGVASTAKRRRLGG